MKEQYKDTYKLVLDPDHWSAISIAAKTFVAQILVENASERPTADELLEMSFLNLAMHEANAASSLRELQSPKRLSMNGGLQYAGSSPKIVEPVSSS